MEDLAPAHQFVLLLIEDLRAGIALRTSVQRYLSAHHNDFARTLLNWRLHLEKGELEEFLSASQKCNLSMYQETLFNLVAQNLRGASILEPLVSLEMEMRQSARQQMEEHLGKLPFKLLLPLLLFQFPSLLMLILGPLLFQLIKEMK